MTSHGFLKTLVNSVMTKDLVTAAPMDSINRIDDEFKKEEFHHMPVIDGNNCIIGMLAYDDIQAVKRIHKITTNGIMSLPMREIMSAYKVCDVMTRDVITVNGTDTLEHCVNLMRENKVHSLPVENSGKLVGMITTYDLLLTASPLPTF